MRLRLIVGLVVVSASAVGAQRPLSLHVAGGVSMPTGAFGDAASPGWHALAGVALGSLMQPIGLRLDVAHNRFDNDVVAGSRGITSYTLNATYRLPMTNSPLSPYVILGGGAYTFGCFGAFACGSNTEFGWNAGLGTKFNALGIRGFVESRLHGVNDDSGNARFVPLTFGVTF